METDQNGLSRMDSHENNLIEVFHIRPNPSPSVLIE